MSDPNQNSVTTWQALAIAAENGDLFLDPEAARNCNTACDNHIQRLQDLQIKAQHLAHVDGWGEFESGKQLRQIFRDRAVGDENSMNNVLQSHIDVVRSMQVVFQKFFTVTTQIDEDNASGIGGVGEPPK